MSRFLSSLGIVLVLLLALSLTVLGIGKLIDAAQWESTHCRPTGTYHTVFLPISTGKTVVIVPMQEPDEVCNQ